MLKEITPKMIDYMRKEPNLISWLELCKGYRITKEIYNEFSDKMRKYIYLLLKYQEISLDAILKLDCDMLYRHKDYILQNDFFTDDEIKEIHNIYFHRVLENRYDTINKIYLDMDGCIFHSCKAVCDILNNRFNRDVKPESITKWNFSDGYADLNLSDDYIEDIFCCDEFFENVEMIDGAREFIEKYKDKIILITKGKWDNINKKRKWLDKNGFKDITMIGIPLNVKKSIISMTENDIFIDDSVNNLESQINSDCALVLFKEYDNETDWSKGWEGDYITSWR